MKQKYSINDCYRILLISPGCSWDELKRAYKIQIKKWHPDRFPANSKQKLLAEDKIKYITVAYKQFSEYYRKYGDLPKTEKTNVAPGPVVGKQPRPEPDQSEEFFDGDLQSSAADKFSRKWFRYSIILFAASYFVYMLFLEPAQKVERAIENRITEDNNSGGKKSDSAQQTQTNRRNNNKTVMAGNMEPKPAAQISNSEKGQQEKKTNGFTTSDQHRVFFTLGSSLGEVIHVQGTPNRVDGDTWYYGESEVQFHEGLVVNWKRKQGSPLKARIIVNELKIAPPPAETNQVDSDTDYRAP